MKRHYRPYPEYKDSGVAWLGQIPAHWDVRRLKFVARIYNGATPKSTEMDYWGGEINWVTPDDLGSLEGRYISKTKRTLTDKGYASCGATLVPAGSIVISTRAPIGHLAIATKSVCTNQGCRSLVPVKDIDNLFLYFVLYAGKAVLQSLGSGSTFQELSARELGNFPVSFPPLPEQRAIAAFLDRETAHIDALIAKKRELIDLLKQQRTAITSHAVTKGLDPSVPLKDSGVEWLGQIPAHWDVRRLKFMCWLSAVYGANVPASDYQQEGIRFLRTTDIDDYGNLLNENPVYISSEAARDYLLDDGDLLFSRSGTIGRSFLYKRNKHHEECAYAGYLVRFSLRQSYSPEFVFYFTKSTAFADWLGLSVIQSTIGNVNGQKYANMHLPVPPLSEQRAIAEYLDCETARIDGLIQKIEESIELLQRQRTALISAAVTGKIDVRNQG